MEGGREKREGGVESTFLAPGSSRSDSAGHQDPGSLYSSPGRHPPHPVQGTN